MHNRSTIKYCNHPVPSGRQTDLFVNTFPQLPGQLLGKLRVLHVHSGDEALRLQRPLRHHHFPEVLEEKKERKKKDNNCMARRVTCARLLSLTGQHSNSAVCLHSLPHPQGHVQQQYSTYMYT